MSNPFKKEMDNIEIPPQLSERSKRGIAQAKAEMPKRMNSPWKGLIIAASLFLIVGFGSLLYMSDMFGHFLKDQSHQLNGSGNDHFTVGESEVDEAEPEMGAQTLYNMKKEITTSDVSAQNNPNVLFYDDVPFQRHDYFTMSDNDALQNKAEKIGDVIEITTEEQNVIRYVIEDLTLMDTFEQATIIGEAFTMKGYDSTHFMLMEQSNEQSGNETYAIFEARKKTLVRNGNDVFSKMNIENNVAQISVQSDATLHDDGIFRDVEQSLLKGTPFPAEQVKQTMQDETVITKEIILHLKDGARIKLHMNSLGFIHYPLDDIYLQLDENIFQRLWEQFDTINIEDK